MSGSSYQARELVKRSVKNIHFIHSISLTVDPLCIFDMESEFDMTQATAKKISKTPGKEKTKVSVKKRPAKKLLAPPKQVLKKNLNQLAVPRCIK